MKMSVRLNVSLDLEDAETLEELAKEKALSPGTLARMLIRNQLREEKKQLKEKAQ